MKYTNDKNYTQFMREIAMEWRERKKTNSTKKMDIEDCIKNNKNILKRILEPLGMLDIFDDERYQFNNKKVFPIHFQILCKVLLMQNRSKKTDFVNKIINGNMKEINEKEIQNFIEELKIEFANWFKLLEYEPLKMGDRNKAELDEVYIEIRQQMFEDGTTQYIEELELDSNYNEAEVKYLKTKFSIEQQEKIFIQSVENNIYYRYKIFQTMEDIHDVIDETVDSKLGMKSFTEDMVLLKDHDSLMLGRVSIPEVIINNNEGQQYQLTNKDKYTILEEMRQDIMKLMDFYNTCVECYIKNRKEDRDASFYYAKAMVIAEQMNEMFGDDEE